MKSPVFQIRLDGAVRSIIERAAAKQGVSISAFFKSAALYRAGQVLEGEGEPTPLVGNRRRPGPRRKAS